MHTEVDQGLFWFVIQWIQDHEKCTLDDIPPEYQGPLAKTLGDRAYACDSMRFLDGKVRGRLAGYKYADDDMAMWRNYDHGNFLDLEQEYIHEKDPVVMDPDVLLSLF